MAFEWLLGKKDKEPPHKGAADVHKKAGETHTTHSGAPTGYHDPHADDALFTDGHSDVEDPHTRESGRGTTATAETGSAATATTTTRRTTAESATVPATNTYYGVSGRPSDDLKESLGTLQNVTHNSAESRHEAAGHRQSREDVANQVRHAAEGGGVELNVDQKWALLNDLVEMGGESTIAQWAAQQQGFKSMQDAQVQLRADNELITVGSGADRDVIAIRNDEQRSWGDKNPLLRDTIKEATKSGAISLAAYGAFAILGGPVSWGAIAGAFVGGQTAKFLTRYFGREKLHRSKKGEKSVALQAMEQLATHVYVARSHAVRLLETINTSQPPLTLEQQDLAIHQTFNQVIHTIHGTSLDRVAEFQRRDKRGRVYEAVASVAGGVLGGMAGGALQSWGDARFGDGTSIDLDGDGHKHIVEYLNGEGGGPEGYHFVIDQFNLDEVAKQHQQDVFNAFSYVTEGDPTKAEAVTQFIFDRAQEKGINLQHVLGGDPTGALLKHGVMDALQTSAMWAVILGIGAKDVIEMGMNGIPQKRRAKSAKNALSHLYDPRFGLPAAPARSATRSGRGGTGAAEAAPATEAGAEAAAAETAEATTEKTTFNYDIKDVEEKRGKELVKKAAVNKAEFRGAAIPENFAAETIEKKDLYPKYEVTFDGKVYFLSDKVIKAGDRALLLSWTALDPKKPEELTVVPIAIPAGQGSYNLVKYIAIQEKTIGKPDTENLRIARSHLIPMPITFQAAMQDEKIKLTEVKEADLSGPDTESLIVAAMGRAELPGTPKKLDKAIHPTDDAAKRKELQERNEELAKPLEIAFPGHIYSAEERGKRSTYKDWKEENMRLRVEADNPNFDVVAKTWSTGEKEDKKTYTVVDSKSGRFRFLFMHDAKERAALLQVDQIEGGVLESFGIAKTRIEARPLTVLDPESTDAKEWDEEFKFAEKVPVVKEYKERIINKKETAPEAKAA